MNIGGWKQIAVAVLGCLGLLWPPCESDPEYPLKIQTWRRSMALTVFLLLAGFSAISLALTSGLPIVGTVAWSKPIEVQAVEHYKALTAKIDEYNKKLERETETTNSLLALDAVSKMRAVKRALCKLPDIAERDRLEAELEQYAQDYYRYLNREFNLQTLACAPSAP